MQLDWPLVSGIQACMTERPGGVSLAPWSAMNLGDHVGDDPQAVAHNRRLLAERLGAQPVFMAQVHGTAVLALGRDTPDGLQADACWTQQRALACTVMVADCLPVLFAHRQGGFVAAAHAGWRGLAAGVLVQTVQTLCRASACEPSAFKAWLGPAIGPEHFEVGPDVVAAFGGGQHFRPKSPGADGQPRWWADLPGLALTQLKGLGLVDVQLSGRCTFSEPANFYSHRRDGRTGRQAVAIWLK